MRGVVVAGATSGVGKTVTVLVMCRVLEHEGYTVQPAKAGPNFIDPSHHAAIVRKPPRTLDPWLGGDDGMRRTHARGEGDICVVKGMMGLYDGDTSTARVAALLDLPVVLIADTRAGTQSVAATAYGFRTYADRMGIDADVAGVIASRVHGGRHAEGIRDALPEELPHLGRIPPGGDLEIPERHLGPYLGDEAPLSDEALDAAADGIRADVLAEVAREPDWDAEEVESGTRAEPAQATDSDRPTIAVARSEAFCFVYPSTLARLESLGTVSYFPPVTGGDLPDCDGVYPPGGYPERFAVDLASSPTLPELADRAADGLSVFGEYGGLMALTESLTTTDGDTHEMTGILPAGATMQERCQALDHVGLHATDGTLTADAGETLRGHEFHYSSADPATDARFAFGVERGIGIDSHEGLTEYRILGIYVHIHPESGAFDRFVSRLTD